MRVLAVFSNPPDQTPLRLDREDKVLARLARQFERDVVIDRQHASDLDNIHSLLLDAVYDVIHFSGHGCEEGLYLDRRDLSEKGELVTPERLLGLLRLAEKPPLVVLFLSCYTHAHLPLLSDAAPFVVTSESAVQDEACITFAEGFYEWLFRGHGCRASFDHARQLLIANGTSPDAFQFSRRSAFTQEGNLCIEAKPDLHQDSIIINLECVRGALGSFGMTQDELLNLLAKKIKVHYWIFARARDSALLPIGRSLFGEFSWDNAAHVVYCRKLMKLSADVPQEHWDLWCRLLMSYNDLASSKYRADANPADPGWDDTLRRTVELFSLHVNRYVRAAQDVIVAAGSADMMPHLGFISSGLESAEIHLDRSEHGEVVRSLEAVLTNYHAIVDALRPPLAQQES